MKRKNAMSKAPSFLRFQLRYSHKDYALVKAAAAADRMSMNTWLVHLSLAAARRKLAKLEAEEA